VLTNLAAVSEYLLTYQAGNKKSECLLTWGVGARAWPVTSTEVLHKIFYFFKKPATIQAWAYIRYR
jgi:hypothetical protein